MPLLHGPANQLMTFYSVDYVCNFLVFCSSQNILGVNLLTVQLVFIIDHMLKKYQLKTWYYYKSVQVVLNDVQVIHTHLFILLRIT